MLSSFFLTIMLFVVFFSAYKNSFIFKSSILSSLCRGYLLVGILIALFLLSFLFPLSLFLSPHFLLFFFSPPTPLSAASRHPGPRLHQSIGCGWAAVALLCLGRGAFLFPQPGTASSRSHTIGWSVVVCWSVYVCVCVYVCLCVCILVCVKREKEKIGERERGGRRGTGVAMGREKFCFTFLCPSSLSLSLSLLLSSHSLSNSLLTPSPFTFHHSHYFIAQAWCSWWPRVWRSIYTAIASLLPSHSVGSSTSFLRMLAKCNRIYLLSFPIFPNGAFFPSH